MRSFARALRTCTSRKLSVVTAVTKPLLLRPALPRLQIVDLSADFRLKDIETYAKVMHVRGYSFFSQFLFRHRRKNRNQVQTVWPGYSTGGVLYQ